MPKMLIGELNGAGLCLFVLVAKIHWEDLYKPLISFNHFPSVLKLKCLANEAMCKPAIRADVCSSNPAAYNCSLDEEFSSVEQQQWQ